LLVVIAILVVLVTLYWAPGSDRRQRALQAACQRNLEKIGVALQIYANDNAGRYPSLPNATRSEEAFALLVPRYTSDTAVFVCPASKDVVPNPANSLTNSKMSYACYMGCGSSNSQDVVVTDAQVNTESKSAGELVFSPDGNPPGNNHGKKGGNLLFSDGHVSAVPPRAPFPLPIRKEERLLNP